MFFTFIKDTLTHNVPLTLLNLILFPAMYYFLHATYPQLVLALLLFSYVSNEFLNMARKQKDRMTKEIVGLTEHELMQKLLSVDIKRLDQLIAKLDKEIEERENDD